MIEEEKKEIIESTIAAFMNIQSLYNALKPEGILCWPALSDAFDWGRISEEEMREEITSILQHHQKTYFRK